MPATLYLVTGPPATGKTAALANRFRERQAAAAESCLWLAPNERSLDDVRRALDGPRDDSGPHRYLTLPDFARRIVRAAEPDARTLPELHQRLMVDSVLGDLSERGRLSHFEKVAECRGFADAVFDFLTELKGQGVGPDAFAAAIRQAEGIDRDKAEQVAAIYAAYQKRLDQRRLLDRLGTYIRARGHWSAGRRGPFAGVRAVFVDGFVDFTPPQLELLATVAESVEELWFAVPTDAEEADSRFELFSRPLATIARLHHLYAGKRIEVHAGQASNGGPTVRPAGLARLERSLFRRDPLAPADDADGLQIVEAPGRLGEVRLTARAVKRLLLEGASPADIMVTARDVGPYVDLIREVFAEYGIPADVEWSVPLIRNPAVGLLLRAARLSADGFPFAAATALLRNNYFAPKWPGFDPETASRSELLLRLLGEPRGRDAFLSTAALWANEPPPGLEDETAEGSRRRRKHLLAKACLPYLRRFFAAWDAMPARGDFAAYAAWLKNLATDLGIADEAERTDAAAWAQFWDEVDAWAEQESAAHARPSPLDPAAAFSWLNRLAAASSCPVSGLNAAGVRVLPAEQARHLACDQLFLLGLGEGNFPAMTGGPIFDESERQALRAVGIEVRSLDDRLPDEMLLFYQLLVRPRKRLVMSYPAVDEKGQSLLPCSFLAACRDCFADGAVPIKKQRMLIEGFDRDPPLCPAEYRVRWAAADNPDVAPPPGPGLTADLFEHLRTARSVANERFRSREFSAYDGLLRSSGVIADLRRRFGSERVFSPTALEDYVACPFRFFLGNVLGLEPLEEPGEEVEHTRRGAAVHRALARLHSRLLADGIAHPPTDLHVRYLTELNRAVMEYAARVSSETAKTLWQLEAKRLERAVARYAAHWEKFRGPWAERRLHLSPHQFEIDFGLDDRGPLGPLVIRHEGIEVRIGGRIDRIDVTELGDGSVGFWVIDYKTGRSGYHTGADVAAFKKLQLPLYALAAEALLFPSGRPLGLAYWIVTDAGPKPALPARPATKWLDAADHWPRFRGELFRWVAELADHIRRGDFPLAPRDRDCTATCAFGEVCRIAQGRPVGKAWELPLPVVGTGDEAATDE